MEFGQESRQHIQAEHKRFREAQCAADIVGAILADRHEKGEVFTWKERMGTSGILRLQTDLPLTPPADMPDTSALLRVSYVCGINERQRHQEEEAIMAGTRPISLYLEFTSPDALGRPQSTVHPIGRIRRPHANLSGLEWSEGTILSSRDSAELIELLREAAELSGVELPTASSE